MKSAPLSCDLPEAELSIKLEPETGGLTISSHREQWTWTAGYKPYFVTQDGRQIDFTQARVQTCETRQDGLGTGLSCSYRDFAAAIADPSGQEIAFETLIWLETVTGDLHMEWIPRASCPGLAAVYWPGPLDFDQVRGDWYTLLNLRQGLQIPNNWPTPLTDLPFNGRFNTAASYMPWFAQVRERRGYLMICQTPANAGYTLKQAPDGSQTRLGLWLEPSLGLMRERYRFLYRFWPDCDYNSICKNYRLYAREQGRLRTLAEKSEQLPLIRQLPGSMVLHKGIKQRVDPSSSFYDPEHPEKNGCLTSFSQRCAELEQLHRLGADKLLLHLDGWAQPGYDNSHPDYFEVCQEAGGPEGLRQLQDTLHQHGDALILHEQYRDYYHTAPTFTLEDACQNPDGSYPGHHFWAGGEQNYLCTSLAPLYLQRNQSRLSAQGIQQDGSYLDVFTCNEGDECANWRHRITRQDSYRYRLDCFNWLLAHGIAPGSEEVNDWAMPAQVFCHYAPYEHMLQAPGTAAAGRPLPLFNLVYHDCVLQPWMMDRLSPQEDHMLYALLNAGLPYLERDPAYSNIDGSFEDKLPLDLPQQLERCRPVAQLNRRLAFQEMLKHEFTAADYSRERTTFADGSTIEIDTKQQTWHYTEA